MVQLVKILGGSVSDDGFCRKGQLNAGNFSLHKNHQVLIMSYTFFSSNLLFFVQQTSILFLRSYFNYYKLLNVN